MSNELTVTGMMQDNAMLEQFVKMSELMSTSKAMVPPHFRGSPGDCLAVVMQSAMWGMNPFAVAQKTHIVSGALGYEAQLVNAVITSTAPTTGRIKYEWFGEWTKVIGKFVTKTNANQKTYKVPGWLPENEEGLGIRVFATIKGESEPRVLELLLTQAQTRNSTLWASDPKQQLAYLAVKRWARLYVPDVLLGVYSEDELQNDLTPKEKDITEEATASTVSDFMSSETEFESDEDKLINHIKCMSESKTEDELKVEFSIAWNWLKDNSLVQFKEQLKEKYRELREKFEQPEIEPEITENTEAA